MVVIFLGVYSQFLNAGKRQPLIIQPQTIDLGYVNENEIPQGVFAVQNISSQDIKILYIYSECDCEIELPLRGNVPAKGVFYIPVKLKVLESTKKNIDEKIVILVDHPIQRELSVRFLAKIVRSEGDKKPAKEINKNITAQESAAIKDIAPAERKYAQKPVVTCYGALFYKEGCIICEKKARILQEVQERYPNLIIKKFLMSNRDAVLLAEKLGVFFNIPEKERLGAPLFVLGNAYLSRSEITREAIERVLLSNDPSLAIRPWKRSSVLTGKTFLLETAKKFSVFGIIAAGLLDGINPCAFATLVLFLSLLSVLKRSRMQIAIVGGVFTLSVFLTYFLVGVGVLSGLQKIIAFSWLTSIIYFISGGFAVLFGLLSWRDAWLAYKHKFKSMVLQLSEAQKRKIHEILSTKTRKMALITGTFLAGSTVSLIELGCTGQVYLPVITYILQIPHLRYYGMFYLLIYNIAFIVPLCFVFVIFFFGTTSKKINEWFLHNIVLMKLGLGAIFILLGIVIFYHLYS